MILFTHTYAVGRGRERCSRRHLSARQLLGRLRQSHPGWRARARHDIFHLVLLDRKVTQLYRRDRTEPSNTRHGQFVEEFSIDLQKNHLYRTKLQVNEGEKVLSSVQPFGFLVNMRVNWAMSVEVFLCSSADVERLFRLFQQNR